MGRAYTQSSAAGSCYIYAGWHVPLLNRCSNLLNTSIVPFCSPGGADLHRDNRLKSVDKEKKSKGIDW